MTGLKLLQKIKNLENYANKYFEEYIPEDSLKKAKLWQKPCPR